MTAGKKEQPEKKEVPPVPESRSKQDVTIRDPAGEQPAVPPMNWESVFRLIGSPVVILSPDHTILHANDAICRATKKTEKELQGMKCWEVFHAPDAAHPPEGCPMKQLVLSRHHETAEMEVSMNGGFYLVSCTPIIDAQGAIGSIIHIATDISEKKQAEQALQNTNLYLTTLSEMEREFAELPSAQRVEELAAKKLLRISGAVVTAFSVYDPVQQILRTSAIEIVPGLLGGLPHIREMAIRLLGMNLEDIHYPISKEMYQDINQSTVGIKKTMTELSYGQIPPLIGASIQSLAGIDRFVHIAHVIEGELFGTSVIGLRPGSSDPPKEFLESFAHIVAASLRRQQAEAALRESEHKYRDIFENSTIGIAHTTPGGRIIDANDMFARLFGYAGAEEFLRDAQIDKFYPAPENRELLLRTLEENGEVRNFETRYVRRDGTSFWGSVTVRTIRDPAGQVHHFEGTIIDITDRREAEDTIRHALAEKEVLLREIHHRVKNNLAGIISIIDLQIDSQSDPAHISLLRNIETRIRSIALIHESLYQTKDLSNVIFADYTQNLMQFLFNAYHTRMDIRYRIEMGDLTLPIGTAMPCGLVMSEIVTNSLKYAFPDTFSCTAESGDTCTITLSLTREEKNYCLRIADNGIGIPEGMDVSQNRSLGLHLISFIVKHQMRGTVEVSTVNGTAYTIRFSEPEAGERKTNG